MSEFGSLVFLIGCIILWPISIPLLFVAGFFDPIINEHFNK